jgi:uncharacterized membrane protein YeaQ/YmgE (transglycosylase-associated protein family)
MQIIIWIVFGGIIGWVASLIMKTDAQQGIMLNVIVGVVGAVLGGWIMSFFGQGSINTFSLYGFLVALLGAVVLLAIARAVSS